MEIRLALVQVTTRPQEVRTPGERVEGVERLLVVRDDRLGDLVVSLPAIHALRETYPGARLALLVDARRASLAAAIRGVDQVIESTRDRRALVSRIRAFAPDLAACISRSARAAWALARARVPYRIGPGHRYYSPLFHRRIDERRRGGARHEVEYALSFAHRAGAPGGPARFDLHLSAESRTSADHWLRQQMISGAFVVLHPGSGGSCPHWPVSHFLELPTMMRGAGISTVISVGPDDRQVRAAVERRFHGQTRRPPCFSGELTELAALLDRAVLVVSNSTGPLHLAAALKTPTLALHAPWPSCAPARWGPYSPSGWAVVADNEEALGWSRATRRRRSDELMAGIAPDAIERAIGLIVGYSGW